MDEKKTKKISTQGKKLKLNVKTARVLNEKELRDVIGGGGDPAPTSPARGSGGCG